MEWPRCDAQPLASLGHGRIVDRLNVDAVLAKQQVARRLAFLRIADEQWDDVGIARHDRESLCPKRSLDPPGAVLLAAALLLRGLEMADRRRRRGADRRRQRGREDEARRIGANRIDQRRTTR